MDLLEPYGNRSPGGAVFFGRRSSPMRTGMRFGLSKEGPWRRDPAQLTAGRLALLLERGEFSRWWRVRVRWLADHLRQRGGEEMTVTGMLAEMGARGGALAQTNQVTDMLRRERGTVRPPLCPFFLHKDRPA